MKVIVCCGPKNNSERVYDAGTPDHRAADHLVPVRTERTRAFVHVYTLLTMAAWRVKNERSDRCRLSTLVSVYFTWR